MDKIPIVEELVRCLEPQKNSMAVKTYGQWKVREEDVAEEDGLSCLGYSLRNTRNVQWNAVCASAVQPRQ